MNDIRASQLLGIKNPKVGSNKGENTRSHSPTSLGLPSGRSLGGWLIRSVFGQHRFGEQNKLGMRTQ